jgi:hypothetical protein
MCVKVYAQGNNDLSSARFELKSKIEKKTKLVIQQNIEAGSKPDWFPIQMKFT